jgi:hypothetical protein
MDAAPEYLSVDNLKNLVNIFERFMEDKYEVASKAMPIDLKRVFFNTMQKLYSDAEYAGMSFRDLNTLTLRTVKPIVLQAIQTSNGTNMNTNLTRERMVFGKRKNNTTHILPEITSKQEGTNIMEHLDIFQKSRDAEFKREPPKGAVNDILATQEIQSMDENEFKAKLQLLEQQREATLLENYNQQQLRKQDATELLKSVDSSTVTSVQVPLKEHQQSPPPSGELKQKAAHDGLKSQTPESHDMARNYELATVMAQQPVIDPKEFYKQTTALHVEGYKDAGNEDRRDVVEDFGAPSLKMSPQLGLKSSFQEFVGKPAHTTVLQEKYILINSVDRDWTLQKFRYQYKVKFNYTSQEIKKIPIYENNPTVPYTMSSASAGIPNTSGWYDNNNTFYAAYDSGAPLGNVVGFEEVTMAADVDANIQTNFKNIHSIQVTKVIIPLDILLENTQSVGVGNKVLFNNNFNLNFPYVLLQIDEFKDMYEGTDDVIRKSFCQLVFENSYQSGNGRGYVVLTPVQHEKKVFLPTALSTLPSLNISLLRPNGELINKSQDGYTMLKVEYEPFNSTYLKVVTNKYFDKNEFFKGDTILIRKYNLFKITGDQDAGHIQAFNDFLNRESGHEVTEIGDANNSGFYRTFYIRAPGKFNEDSGSYDVEQNLIDQVVLFNNNFELCDAPMNGFILNISLQNSISMKIEQKVYDSFKFESENI